MKKIKGLLLLVLAIESNAFSQQKINPEDQLQPNILWITIEDTSPQFIGCYGNKSVSTPNIDKLAQQGVRFTNAFSTSTVSSPSRSCIISGLKTYKTGTGNHRSQYPIPKFIKGFPYFMRQVGYYTINNHKTDYNIANEKEFIQEAWCESSNKASWRNRQPGQPFFAIFNFIDSHQSRTMTNSYSWYRQNVLEKLSKKERIKHSTFEMPPFYNDSPEMRKHFSRVYNSIKLTDNKIGKLLRQLKEDNLADSTIIFFFADHGSGIPRGKTNGINLGYRVPFIIWFPEMYKHLSPWGTSGIVNDELIDFEDLAPTLINLAGGSIPNYMKGRIFMGNKRNSSPDYLHLSSDRADNGIDLVRSVTDGKYIYSRNFMPFTPQCRYIRYTEISEIKQQMNNDLKENILTPLQKSLFEDRPHEFLYNVKTDIWETINLINNPNYKSILEKMRTEMQHEILNSQDILFLPEYELSSISDTTTLYEFRKDNGKYPIKDIYEAASLSGYRDANTVKTQIELLNNTNKIIRYWAIIGLRAQNREDLLPFSKEIHNAINDKYPPIAITASAIAFQEFGSNTAKNVLKNMCLNDNMDLALMTINYLLYIDNKAPFIETIKNVLKMENRNYNVKAACMDFLGILGLVPNNSDFEI